ncbi:MAG: HAD family hydrolase [Nitrospirae bacterium]|nr:MAG: HAD family hydrolase [Nitrospirota bacterium]
MKSLKQTYRAMLMDVDGTLYHQGLLRCLMACELGLLPLRVCSWSRSKQIVQTLRWYRRVREELREVGRPSFSLYEHQFQKTAERIGSSPSHVHAIVDEWINRRPLKYLPLCKRQGIEAFLIWAKGRSMRIGVFSDYPVQEKIEALGLAEYVDLMLCATDREINAFKPHVRGFLYACERWNVKPYDVLYIGDRPEVDAVGAKAIGMPCAIINGRKIRLQSNSISHMTVPSFPHLQYILSHGRF